MEAEARTAADAANSAARIAKKEEKKLKEKTLKRGAIGRRAR